MYDWKQRPVSEQGPALPPVFLWLVMGILLFLPVSAAAAARGNPGVVLLAPAGWRPNPAEESWLADDRSWLRNQPPAEWLLEEKTAWTDADSLASLRRLLNATASADHDSFPALRPISSRLLGRWQARGYLSCVVKMRRAPQSLPGSSAVAAPGRAAPDTLFVTPGPAWTYAEISVTGEDFPGKEHLLKVWLPRPGERFAAEDLALAIGRILSGVGELGYPFPRWSTRSVQLDSSTATVVIEASLLPGNRSWIGPRTSDLPAGRGQRFLVRASGLEAGALFRQTDIQRAIDRLVARDLYATVGQPVVYLTSAPDSVGIHFPVVPRRKVNRLQVVLGLSRQEESGGSRISGQVDLRLPNMGGSGRSLQVGWRDDGINKSRFGFSYLEPLAFGTPLDMELALDQEIQKDDYTRIRLDNRWRLPVVALLGIEL
jgi:hypothetical protein